MTRYRFLDAFGGAEIEAERQPNSNFAYWSDAPTEERCIPLWMLREVPPPIPAEPEPGAYLIGDVLAVRFPDASDFDYHWKWSDVDTDSWPTCWKSLGGPDVTITKLVAIPEVELPWEFTDADGDTVYVTRTRSRFANPGDVYVKGDAYVPGDLLAAAALSAARAARSKP